MRFHFSIRMCFRLGTDGLYCVTKGNISLRTLVFSWRAFFLSENLTSESVLSINLFGIGTRVKDRFLFKSCSFVDACVKEDDFFIRNISSEFYCRMVVICMLNEVVNFLSISVP